MRAVIFLLLCLVPLSASAWQAPFPAKVIAVTDGDTFTVMLDRQQVKIRLYGIDCPEKEQAFGNRARQATADAVHGKMVEVQPTDTDRHGWTLAFVFMPGVSRSLNEYLVREGMAWVYPQSCKAEALCAALRKLEQEARASKRGLWSEKNPVPPWEWRKR